MGYLNVPRIDVAVAENIDEALNLLESDPSREILAAGTEIITALTMGTKKARKFVDITRISELNEIKAENGRFSVGALVTHYRLASAMGKKVPAFDKFFENYSSPAVAYRATVGGSVMLRRATEDLLPILLCLDAELLFATRDGEKKISLHDFLVKGMHGMALLKSVVFSVSGRCVFDKLWMGVSRYPLMAVAVNMKEGAVRIAVSHKDVETPGRVVSVEKFLESRPLNDDVLAKAAELLSDSINPVDDVLASSWYRRRAAGVLLRRLLSRYSGGGV